LLSTKRTITALICHYVCAKDEIVADKCTTGFVRSQIEKSFKPPIKCPVCPAPVIVTTFERYLNNDQTNELKKRVTESAMKPGESLLDLFNADGSEEDSSSSSKSYKRSSHSIIWLPALTAASVASSSSFSSSSSS